MNYYTKGIQGENSMEKVAKDKMNRYIHIDMLKFLAIMFVLFYHGNIQPINFESNPSFRTYFNYYIMAIFSTGVPLFFLVNGYLLFNKSLHMRRHCEKIVKYIGITLIWAVITVCVLMPIKGEWLSFVDFCRVIWEWRQGWINHLWFMGALVGIYLFFPLLKIVFDYNKKYFLYFICVCAVMTFGNDLLNMLFNVLSWLANGEYIVEINCFSIFNPFREIKGWTVVYFCCGGLLGYYNEEIIRYFNSRKKTVNIVLAIVMLFSCVGLWLYSILVSVLSGQRQDIVWYGYDTIFTLMNVFSIYLISLNYAKRFIGQALFIEEVSKNTLGIYFLHEIFIHLTISYVLSIEISRNIIGNGIYVIFIEALCLITIYLLKKIPLLKRLL